MPTTTTYGSCTDCCEQPDDCQWCDPQANTYSVDLDMSTAGADTAVCDNGIGSCQETPPNSPRCNTDRTYQLSYNGEPDCDYSGIANVADNCSVINSSAALYVDDVDAPTLVTLQIDFHGCDGGVHLIDNVYYELPFAEWDCDGENIMDYVSADQTVCSGYPSTVTVEYVP